MKRCVKSIFAVKERRFIPRSRGRPNNRRLVNRRSLSSPLSILDNSKMYIWRKRVTENWLERRNEELERRFGATLAIVERPGTIRILLEISCSKGGQARKLREEFGGQIKK